MPDLITRERALRNLGALTPAAADNLLIDALVAAVSRAVENHCRRAFVVQRYDELYPGSGRAELLLRHYPIVGVERVANGARAVLRVGNSSGLTQRATVQVTDTGLSLVRVAAGATTGTTLAFADYVTLATLAAAVNALGNGWSAAVLDAADNNRAAADLRAIQGAYSAKDLAADLTLHTRELASYGVDAERGFLTRDGGWLGGPMAWRVVYAAGFPAVPDDVQEACAAWVAALFWQARRDPGLAQETLPGVVARSPLDDIPASVRTFLAPYRRLRV